MYENNPNKRFDIIFGTIQPGSDQLYVSGVQGAGGAFTQDFCDASPPVARLAHLHLRGWRNTDTDTYGYSHSHSYGDSHSDGYSNSHSYGYGYSYSDGYSTPPRPTPTPRPRGTPPPRP